MKKFLSYLFLILLPLSVGGLSSLLTMKNMNIYSEIIAPPLSPPGILFPIVWTVLYILMGISAARVKQSNDPKKAQALKTYYLQFFFK